MLSEAQDQTIISIFSGGKEIPKGIHKVLGHAYLVPPSTFSKHLLLLFNQRPGIFPPYHQFSTGGNFAPVAMFGKNFGCHNWVDVTGIQWAKASGSIKHPTKNRRAPTTKNLWLTMSVVPRLRKTSPNRNLKVEK